jgi:hypothetical protein
MIDPAVKEYISWLVLSYESILTLTIEQKLFSQPLRSSEGLYSSVSLYLVALPVCQTTSSLTARPATCGRKMTGMR